MTSKTKHQKRPAKPRKIISTRILVALLLLLAYDLALGSNIQFYAKWIQCGQKPLVGKGSGFLNDGVSHYRESPTFSLLRAHPELFCTPLDAEREGFSANAKSYDFPHLRAAGEESPVLRDIREGREQRQLY